MAKKLFGKNIEPACEYCAFGKITSDRKMVACEKCGIVAPFYSCRKYYYDPLKRVPKKANKLSSYGEDEFKL
jgi:hypothetical protein